MRLLTLILCEILVRDSSETGSKSGASSVEGPYRVRARSKTAHGNCMCNSAVVCGNRPSRAYGTRTSDPTAVHVIDNPRTFTPIQSTFPITPGRDVETHTYIYEDYLGSAAGYATSQGQPSLRKPCNVTAALHE